MFQIIQNNTVVALCENPGWVYLQDNGCFDLCLMQDATGIVVDGTVYHIDGRDMIGDIETVIVRDVSAVSARITDLKTSLTSYDYIGVKIATGRATMEEYADQIAEMNVWAAEINVLQDMLHDPDGTIVALNVEINQDTIEDDEDSEEDLEEDDEWLDDEPDEEELE